MRSSALTSRQRRLIDGLARACLAEGLRNADLFPWRNVSDPWLATIAEIMLQRTRAQTVAPIFERFAKTWGGGPCVVANYFGRGELDLTTVRGADKLREDLRELLKPLGFVNKRMETIIAVADILCAMRRVPMDRPSGRPPTIDREAILRALGEVRGVGDYTVNAVASMAFGMRLGIVDVNVRRVLGRVMRFRAHGGALERRIVETARVFAQTVPDVRLGHYGILDIGRDHCHPVKPRCGSCPARGICLSATS